MNEMFRDSIWSEIIIFFFNKCVNSKTVKRNTCQNIIVEHFIIHICWKVCTGMPRFTWYFF